VNVFPLVKQQYWYIYIQNYLIIGYLLVNKLK
jgi:hypothetical protein